MLKVFGITRPGIEPRSPGPLVNSIPIQTDTKGKPKCARLGRNGDTLGIVQEIEI